MVFFAIQKVRSKFARAINDYGSIIGTATYTPQGTNDTNPAGPHGVMLLPIEFVTDDGQGGFAQQSFTYNGTATPVIDASASSASIDASGNISATIAGSVTDQTSDCTPTASKQVQSLTIQAGGSSTQVNLSNSGTPDPTTPWHPYKYLANYSQNVSFAVDGTGQFPIEVTTSLNAAGMAGNLELVANVTTKTNQGNYNLVLPSNFAANGTNQINFYEGASDPGIGNETLTETGPGTNVFTGQLFFANITVTINTFAGLTSNIDQLEATIVFTYSNGETKQTDVQFTETGATTDTFSAQVPEEIDGIDLGGLLNLTLPASFSPTAPDTVQTFAGSSAPTQGPFVLTEDANNSLSFVGTTSWALAQAQIVGFTGLTSGIDTITANWTFTYPDGHQVTLNNVSMVETGATTNQFTYNLGAKVIYDVALISSGSQNAGNFSPTIIRFKGPEVSGMTINVMNHDWQVAKKTYADGDHWYLVDANNNPVVFNPEVNAHTDIQTTSIDPTKGLSITIKNSSGITIGTDSLPATTGLLVYQNDVSSLLGNLTNWEEKTWTVKGKDGNGNPTTKTAYNYRPKSGQTVGYSQTDVNTEILWRYVGQANMIAQFNSGNELSTDIAYRLAVVNLIRNKQNWFNFGEDPQLGPTGNPSYWGARNPGALWQGSPYETTSMIPSLNDMFSDDAVTENKYSMDCFAAVVFASLKGASSAMSQSAFDSQFPPHFPIYDQNFLSINSFNNLWYQYEVSPSNNVVAWVPGDRGYIANTGQASSNVFAGANIIYLGGCFSSDPTTFQNNADFFSHVTPNPLLPNQGQIQKLSSWINEVNGWNGGYQIQTYRCTLKQP